LLKRSAAQYVSLAGAISQTPIPLSAARALSDVDLAQYAIALLRKPEITPKKHMGRILSLLPNVSSYIQGIVSGRDLADLQQPVAINGLAALATLDWRFVVTSQLSRLVRSEPSLDPRRYFLKATASQICGRGSWRQGSGVEAALMDMRR
jgi:hypothetical protein